MGMAASQARLLCITARIHDVEYQAQAIQAAKIQLATQEDQAYREYNAALDATTLTLNSINPQTGKKTLVPANFNNLCSRSRLMGADGNQYALRDQKGRLIVEEEIENAYNQNKGAFSTGYEFALFMLGGAGENQGIGNAGNDYNQKVKDAEEAIVSGLTENEMGSYLKGLRSKLEEYTASGSDIYDRASVAKEDWEKYDKTLAAYKKSLYSKYAADINEKLYELNGEIAPNEKEDFDTELFNYYVEIYNQIESVKDEGGCVSIQDFDGFNGDAANDNEWLQAMVQCGQITIEIIEKDKTTGEIDLDTTAVSSDISLSNTPTSQIDNRALAKAEAEYEHKLKQIDKKDKQYDLELSKLETERSALTTEYDSVKKVIQDNIERTFGIFS